MSATPSAGYSTPVNQPVAVSGGRRPRPKTLKRRLQNREAQRKYREKQARIIEDLKRSAAAAPVGNSINQSKTAPQLSSSANQFITAPHPNQGVHLSQSLEEADEGLLDPELSVNFMQTGDLDLEFPRSFIPDNRVSLPWDNDGLTAQQPFLGQGTSITYQPVPIHTPDGNNFGPLSSDESNLYSAEALEPTDSIHFWAQSIDLTYLNLEPSRRQSIGGNRPNFMPISSNSDMFHPIPHINLDPKLDHRTSTLYLNEYGTIDQRENQLEPFRRLFQLDNTSENNQLISLVVERKHEIREIMLAGFRAINSRANSSKEAMNLLSSPFLADPYKNNLRLVRVATLDAYLSNALSLGMDIPTLYLDRCPSPFYHPRSNSSEDVRKSVAKMSARIPEHLRPTPPQVLCLHHPYLDLLPFPILRARAIALTSRNPPLINAAELKSDIMNEGLICWRTSGSGTGQPWDMKSWEAAPWFLRKWSILVGGEEEEVWKQTKWWRELRGEERISTI